MEAQDLWIGVQSNSHRPLQKKPDCTADFHL